MTESKTLAYAQATESKTFNSTNTSSKYLNRKRGCRSFSVQNISIHCNRQNSLIRLCFLYKQLNLSQSTDTSDANDEV